VTFHVGSQCRNPEKLAPSLGKGGERSSEVMSKAGLKPRLLNIGGGFPVRQRQADPARRGDRGRS